MNNEEITNGNKLIAEFMQAKNDISDIYYLPEFGHYFNSYGQIEWNECFRSNELKYHSSWDWLMPVVEKIKRTPSYDCGDAFGTSVLISDLCIIRSNHYNITGKLYPDDQYFNKAFREETLLISVWTAVVEFIKWWNEKQKE